MKDSEREDINLLLSQIGRRLATEKCNQLYLGSSQLGFTVGLIKLCHNIVANGPGSISNEGKNILSHATACLCDLADNDDNKRIFMDKALNLMPLLIEVFRSLKGTEAYKKCSSDH